MAYLRMDAIGLLFFAAAFCAVPSRACDFNEGGPLPPLMLAAKANDVAQMRGLLKKGANPNQRWHEKAMSNFHEGPPCSVSVLTMVAEGGGPAIGSHVESVRALLDAGAKVQSKADQAPYAWLAAARVGDFAVVKLLWERGDEPALRREAPLMISFASGSVRIVPADPAQRALLDVLEDYLLPAARNFWQTESLRAIPELQPLLLQLLENGVQPTARTLVAVAELDEVELFASVLQHGAPVNGPNNDGKAATHGALMDIAANGRPRAAAALLGAGADLDATDNLGMTALDYAVQGGRQCGVGQAVSCDGNLATVKLLLARGARADRAVSGARSALELARSLPEPARQQFVALLEAVPPR
jgi:ankyrin repeat protein